MIFKCGFEVVKTNCGSRVAVFFEQEGANEKVSGIFKAIMSALLLNIGKN